ncbi:MULTISPECIES: aldehyde dehydrogenase family protein [unclassified Amycolatopsis]|uniref:aldehyde dehydrogenase family protein n=1 Tax=unclassified Amycolatopsis TaxID=2618356 RepID=UPI001C69C171|nr:aldehyde dehydrogenase family protein [Amycolatopsis sp. DSM 110486]QYN20201.1 aldehyde dehydrogenase family protein [Amycolatopsis sp. DSM 110486]
MVIGTTESNRTRVHELLSADWRLLVGGRLVEAPGHRTFEVTSPIDGKMIATVPDADAELVDDAVAHAESAFPAWRDLDVLERAARVRELADVVEANIDDLALLDAVDGGAPMAVMAGDVHMAAGLCRYFAGLALEMKGFSLPTGDLHFTVRQPYGVVAKIVPFNHPILFAISKLAAPLVAGNCVILKPAEATPLSALHLARLIQHVFPPGVVQIVVGDGPAVPRSLVRHPGVARIGFTGSETTGRSIMRDAAQTGVKEVSLELGGKNALIAYPDADPVEVAHGAVQGMNFTWSGQSCGSTSRLLVHESIADAVVAGMVERLKDHVIGSPLDPVSDQGPLVSREQHEKVLRYITGAIEKGAVVVTGGGRPAGLDIGNYLEPTILDHVDATWQVATEEIFGPVLSVIRWSDEEDPVAIANSVRYGLTGSVYTNDVRRALRVAQRLDAGYVWINETGKHFLGMPFGGFKASGLGREESIDELLSYTEVKSINVKL